MEEHKIVRAYQVEDLESDLLIRGACCYYEQTNGLKKIRPPGGPAYL